MSFGFELFDSGGNKTLSSDSIAHLLIDTFEVSHPNSGTKEYTNIPGGMVLVADWAIIDITLNTQFQHVFLNGNPSISINGNFVSWDWGPGFNDIQSISIRVFAS